MGWGTVGAWSIITFYTPARTPPPLTQGRLGWAPRGRDTHGSVDGGTSQLATTLVHKPRTGRSRTRNIAESMRLLVPEGGSRRGHGPDYGYMAVMTRLSTVDMHGRHQSSSSDHQSPGHDTPRLTQNTHTTTLRCIILYNIAHYVHKYYCLQIILEFSRCDTCDGWRRVNECSRVGGWSPGADHLVPDCTFNCWRG